MREECKYLMYYFAINSFYISSPQGLVRYNKPFNINSDFRLGFNWLFVVETTRTKLQK